MQIFKHIFKETAVLLKMLLPGEEKITLGFKDADRFKYFTVAIERSHPDKFPFSGGFASSH